MTFCGNCGAQHEAGTRFCAACGAPMTGAAQAPLPGAGHPSGASNTPAGSAAHSSSTPTSDGAPSDARPSGASAAGASPAGATAPSQPAGAAPWASAAPGAPSKPPSAAKPRKPLPLLPLVAAGAVLAIGLGAGSAYFIMRGSGDDSATGTLTTSLLSQQGEAPTKAPGQIWKLSNADILRGAGVDENTSSTAALLSYGNNGMLLMSVPNTAVVAVKENPGAVAWQVKGTFSQCLPLVNKGGWACIYAPPSDDSSGSSASSQTATRQLVTLDGNGRLNKIKDLDGNESLYQEKTGTLWLLDGIGDSANEDAGAATQQNASVSATRLDDSGKALWTYAHNLSMSYDTLPARGQAAAPLFTSGDLTYIANAQDSNGHGVALDASGKQTDKLKSAALANDNGRPITQEKDAFLDGGKKMKSDVRSVAAPTLADTGSLPLYSFTDTAMTKLTSSGSTAQWEAGASGATPLAYCGSTTIATSQQNVTWFLDKNGKEVTSKTLSGTPQFCWGGTQLVTFDSSSSTVTAYTTAGGDEAWKFTLPSDQGGSQAQSITYSPTSDGFVAAGDGIAYYGPSK